jgi:signal recognition particle subunit SRP54
MGDVLTLIEKAQEVVTEEEAKKLQKKMMENAFTLEDYLTQFESMKKMGGAQAMLAMMPGMNGKVKPEDIDEKKLERTKAIILSMTAQERRDPSIINSNRKKRIANGSGTSVQEINQLLKQFEQTKILMKQLKSGKRRLPF